jgi:very-short-patch-repair endonuclease
MKTCENCSLKYDDVDNKRFCSVKCSKAFSTKAKREQINKKVSSKLKGRGNSEVNKICEICEIEFTVSYPKRNQKCCSVKCSSILRWKNPEYASKMSEHSSKSATIKHKSDTGFGWKTRKNLEPSYPEKIAISILDELKIKYEREYKIKRYFVDFVIHEFKIAIEIDGQQHKLEERKKIDEIKDSLLISNGWKVYRIKYPEENIKEKIIEITASIPFA